MVGEAQTERYDGVARLLHWLTVLLVAVQFAVAWTMPDIHRGTPPTGLVAWHLSIGTVILLVMLIRAGWRLTHREPLPPRSLSPAMQVASRATHLLLYFVLVALPLLGWANASSRGYRVMLFNVVPLPPLATIGSSVGHALGDIHQTLALVLLALVGLHLFGALYHLAIVGDRTLQRML